MLRYQQRLMSRVFHSTWMRYLSLMVLRRAREAAGSQLVEMSNRGRQKHSPKSVLVWHLRQHGHQNPKQPDRRQTDQVTHTHMHTHGHTHTHTLNTLTDLHVITTVTDAAAPHLSLYVSRGPKNAWLYVHYRHRLDCHHYGYTEDNANQKHCQRSAQVIWSWVIWGTENNTHESCWFNTQLLNCRFVIRLFCYSAKILLEFKHLRSQRIHLLSLLPEGAGQ